MEGVLLDWARTVWYEVPSIISSNDNLKFLFIDLRRNVLHSSIAEAAFFFIDVDCILVWHVGNVIKSCTPVSKICM